MTDRQVNSRSTASFPVRAAMCMPDGSRGFPPIIVQRRQRSGQAAARRVGCTKPLTSDSWTAECPTSAVVVDDDADGSARSVGPVGGPPDDDAAVRATEEAPPFPTDVVSPVPPTPRVIVVGDRRLGETASVQLDGAGDGEPRNDTPSHPTRTELVPVRDRVRIGVGRGHGVEAEPVHRGSRQHLVVVAESHRRSCRQHARERDRRRRPRAGNHVADPLCATDIEQCCGDDLGRGVARRSVNRRVDEPDHVGVVVEHIEMQPVLVGADRRVESTRRAEGVGPDHRSSGPTDVADDEPSRPTTTRESASSSLTSPSIARTAS